VVLFAGSSTVLRTVFYEMGMFIYRVQREGGGMGMFIYRVLREGSPTLVV
jgi:hypothetical protein